MAAPNEAVFGITTSPTPSATALICRLSHAFAAHRLAVLLTCFAAGAAAQQRPPATTVVPDQVACPRCTIELTPALRITVDSGPGIIADPHRVLRDSQGRYIITSGLIPGEVRAYDAAGRYLAHLTREGSGPGQARGLPLILVGTDDSVRVFDTTNARYSVFSPSFHLSREEPFRLPVFAASELDRERIIVVAPHVVSGKWLQFHVIHKRGNLLSSFGTPTGNVSPVQSFVLWRQIVVTRQRTIWAVPNFSNYEIEEWSDDGRLIRTLTRDAPWYAPSGPEAQLRWISGVTTPPAAIPAVHVDAEGRLWILSLVAKDDWKRAYERRDVQSPPGYLKFDTVIEVIDPGRGRVLARRRLPILATGFVGPDLFSYAESETGVPTITIWTVGFTSPGKE